MLWHIFGRPLQDSPNKKVKHPRLRRWTFAIAYRLGLAPLLLVPLWFAFVYALMHPPREAFSVSPERYRLTSRDVRFPSGDGVQLEGWYINSASSADLTAHGRWKQRRPGVVLCHGYGAARDQLLSPLGVDLVNAGYDVLLFDFRGHGTSGDSPVSMGPVETADVIAAVRCLRNQPGVDAERIGVLGLGMGGYAGILAAGRVQDIRCVVAVDTYPSVSTTLRRRMSRAGLPAAAGDALSWGMGMYFGQHRIDDSAAEVAAAFEKQGLLLITGGDNERAPITDLDRVLHVANCQTARLVIPGARNGQALFNRLTSRMVLQYLDAMLTGKTNEAQVVVQPNDSLGIGKIELTPADPEAMADKPRAPAEP